MSLLTNLNSNVACASCVSDVPQMIPNLPNHRNMSHAVECAENCRRCIWAVRSCRLPNFDQSLYEKGDAFNTCEKVTFTDDRMLRQAVKLITLITVRKHAGGQERLNLFGITLSEESWESYDERMIVVPYFRLFHLSNRHLHQWVMWKAAVWG